MTIPKVQESEEKRKLRILAEEVDRLRELVGKLERKQAADSLMPNQREDAPIPVQWAWNYIQQYQAVTRNHTTLNPFTGETVEIPPRKATEEEQIMLTAASDLVTQYFKRNNPALVEGVAKKRRIK